MISDIEKTGRRQIEEWVNRAANQTKITDIHTHLFSPNFGANLLWGIDELINYHYLISETFRWIDLPYDDYWKMNRRQQADLIWKTLFLDHSPVSEACRGILTTLERLGLDASSRDLEAYRRYFQGRTAEEYVDQVFELANLESVVMTNDPFDDTERPVWENDRQNVDKRFHAVLRLDAMLNAWETGSQKLRQWGYHVEQDFSGETEAEARRFLSDWIQRMDAKYMAVSLPPDFAFPEDSARGRLIAECILPVAQQTHRPFAMMIGVKKLTNPELRLAGDSVGKASIEVVEYLCRYYPDVKFLVTMLSRENQHELCVATRKFRNLMVFGCWWFLNNPSLIEEMERMRFELIGLSMIPQHSDARVLDQVVYKWDHSRRIIAGVLTDKYTDIAASGWKVTEEEIRRDVQDLFSDNFWDFVNR